MEISSITKKRKNEILQEVFSWLKEHGFNVIFNKEDCYLEIKRVVFKITIQIFIRVVDELNLELTAPYLPIPEGQLRNLSIWKDSIIARGRFRLDTNNGRAWFTVCFPFQLTVKRTDDVSRLFRIMGDVAVPFLDYKNDVACAKELGLKFNIDI